MTTPWYPIMAGAAMVLTALISYYSSQVSIAAELGDRPTRAEMRDTVKGYTDTVQRELDTIKESLREGREDMRAIRRYIESQGSHSSHGIINWSGVEADARNNPEGTSTGR